MFKQQHNDVPPAATNLATILTNRTTVGDTTVSNNTSSGSNGTGGGITAICCSGSSFVNARDTIIALNTATTGPDLGGALTSYGFNLIGNSTVYYSFSFIK